MDAMRVPAIGQQEIDAAYTTLQKYKSGKAALESRVVDGELWYKIQHNLTQHRDSKRPPPTSAWLFNTLLNKHADAMDNYPEPNVLPREQSDTESASKLSSIMPVVLERCGFEGTYSDGWWEKLKHGASLYGVFWDKTLDHGLGDISIRTIDLMNIFWEPGITDMQKSRNLFIVDLEDSDLLEQEYPQLEGRAGTFAGEVTRYISDESLDTSGKTAVIDWYYKKRQRGGNTILHYAKFAAGTLLFASENEPGYEDGWYTHGKYPVVVDNLFPVKDSPVGFGWIAVTHNPQTYIDRIDKGILDSAERMSRKRWFVSQNCNVNLAQYKNLDEQFVEVSGASLDDDHIREITEKPLPSIVVNVRQNKIEEMKETSSNRDFTNGGTAAGVTAAAAIAALQEAGNKTSRDMLSASYRAYTDLTYLCIDLMRQFYDERRSFRITGASGGEYQYVDFAGTEIAEQPTGTATTGEQLYRVPIFDVSVRPQRRSPYSRMAQNELAKEMYGMGFFNPERAQEVLTALEMMEFEGKDAVVEKVNQGATLMNQLQQLMQMLEGLGLGGGAPVPGAPSGAPAMPPGGGKGAMSPPGPDMTAYGERLAKRASTNMDMPGAML